MGLFSATKKKQKEVDQPPALDAPPPLVPKQNGEESQANSQEDMDLPPLPHRQRSAQMPTMGSIPSLNASGFPLPPEHADAQPNSDLHADEGTVQFGTSQTNTELSNQLPSEQKQTVFDDHHDGPLFPEVPENKKLSLGEQLEEPISVKQTPEAKPSTPSKANDQEDLFSRIPEPIIAQPDTNLFGSTEQKDVEAHPEEVPTESHETIMQQQSVEEEPQHEFAFEHPPEPQIHEGNSGVPANAENDDFFISVAQYRDVVVENNELKHSLDTAHDTLFRMMQLHNDKDQLFRELQECLEVLQEKITQIDDELFRIR